MNFSLLLQLDWILRIVVAGACGMVIGYERDSRAKEAGVRTHLIVALGAAMLMVVSKYGFLDVMTRTGVSYDPSRIASLVVSGIGFLGAGMIFVRHQYVNGLTTAAGIWATAGVGLAVGAGMYFLGIGCAILILVSQIVLHKNTRWIKPLSLVHLTVTVAEQAGLDRVQDYFEEHDIEIVNLKMDKQADGIEVSMNVQMPTDLSLAHVVKRLSQYKQVESVEY